MESVRIERHGYSEAVGISANGILRGRTARLSFARVVYLNLYHKYKYQLISNMTYHTHLLRCSVRRSQSANENEIAKGRIESGSVRRHGYQTTRPLARAVYL